MSDPLLTTLCGICRAVPPKYKCPRCGIGYCSVPCNRRHRARAGCSGIRDVTAFVPRKRLQTDAGLDHDYNFMHGIEVSVSRNRKHMIEDRQLLHPRDWQDEQQQQQQQQQHHSRQGHLNHNNNNNKHKRLQFVPAVPRDLQYYLDSSNSSGGGANNVRLTRKIQALCRRGDIELLRAPAASARQRENSTNVATIASRDATSSHATGKKTRAAHIRWQVEWQVYEDGIAAKPTRILRRQFDNVPVYRAYAATMAWLVQEQGGAPVEEVEEAGDAGDAEEEGVDEGVMVDGAEEGRTGNEHGKAAEAPAPSKEQEKYAQQTQMQTLDMLVDNTSSRSFYSVYAFQNPETGAWMRKGGGGGGGGGDGVQESSAAAAAAAAVLHSAKEATKDDQMDDEDALAAKRRFRYFLLQPQVPSRVVGRPPVAGKDALPPPRRSKELIPIDAVDTLTTALRGRSVLEFPTIYVLPRGASPADKDDSHAQYDDEGEELPSGHVLGSTARREGSSAAQGHAAQKRTAAAAAASQQPLQQPRDAKKRKTGHAVDDPDGDEDMADAEEANAAASRNPLQMDESETSSEGTSSEDDDSEEDDDDDDDDDDEQEEEDEQEGEILKLIKEVAESNDNGVLASNAVAPSKPGLVVYESWSEGSGDEAD